MHNRGKTAGTVIMAVLAGILIFIILLAVGEWVQSCGERGGTPVRSIIGYTCIEAVQP